MSRDDDDAERSDAEERRHYPAANDAERSDARGAAQMSKEVDGLTEADLRELAEKGAAELEGASASDLLRWTDENFGGVGGPRSTATCNYVVASNMQDAVLVDLAAKVRPGVPVLFLDTGYHFVETIGTRDAIEAVYDVRVLNVTPEHSVAEQD